MIVTVSAAELWQLSISGLSLLFLYSFVFFTFTKLWYCPLLAKIILLFIAFAFILAVNIVAYLK